MKFVADENLDAEIVKRLRQDGHTIWYVAELERGISDDAVLYLANEQDAPLLTADKDFGELAFRLRRITSGVILIRLSGLSASRKAEIVSNAITQHTHELLGSFTVITATTIRVRKVESS